MLTILNFIDLVFHNSNLNIESTLNSITFINSPLESENLELIQSILSKVLILHCCMFYLVVTLILILTFKIVGDKKLYTSYWQSKIQSLPRGKTINNLALKLINIYRINSLIWIYFILGSIFMAICFSTFCVYACLIGLKG